MTPKQLSKLGMKLGDGWQSKLSRLMPCNVRTIRYWLSGNRKIRPMVAARIKEVINTTTEPTDE
jgi:hypothetical protein